MQMLAFCFRMILVCLLILTLVYSAHGNNLKNASVTYDESTQKFILHDFIAEHPVAQGSFKDEIFLTGWSYLEVNTSKWYPDPVQAYAAGLVEGYLTQDLMKKHWNNMAADYCSNEEQYCKRLRDFLEKNLEFIRRNIQRREYDIYWHQVALTLEQLHGVEDGYKNVTSEPSIEVDVFGILLLNLFGDFEDLEIALNKTVKKVHGAGSCSSLIKPLSNNSDIYFSHVTWTSYQSMLRILKKYEIQVPTDMSADAPVVPGHTYSFSSQPGVIFSVDDFYLISSGLAAMETTIANDNSSLYQYVTPVGTILEWQRNIIANRLAKSGEQWVGLFGIMNSGTYNNQWMILDYNKFKPNQPLEDGLLHIIEQLPGYLHSADVTDVLRTQGYWSSYNIAYFKDIFNMSGGPENVKKFGNFFSYERSPRSLIFKRDHTKVEDIPSMIKLMRYNDYTNDPLSRCNCTPPYSADCAISSRSDLNPENGTYQIEALGHLQQGGTDMKLTTFQLFKSFQFIAISGPTYDPLPPFQWSKSDFDKKVKHEGHPDLWKFKPIIHKWL